MHKIMITGNAGSGKTTLSYKLAKILNRQDIISLDKIVWNPGWILVDKEEKEFELAKITKMQNWIVDGVSKTLLEAADTILFLDYPRHVCYWRAFRRNCKYIFKSRPEKGSSLDNRHILKLSLSIIKTHHHISGASSACQRKE